MKKIAFLLLVLFASNIAFSQELGYNYGTFEKETLVRIWENDALVYEKPDFESNILATLKMGDVVKIVAFDEETMKIYDESSNDSWYQVEFEEDGKTKIGTIRSEFLAITSVQTKSNELFLFQFWIDSQSPNTKGIIRIVQNHQKTYEQTFDIMGDIGYCVQSKLLDSNLGLENVKNIWSIDFSYGACGAANGTTYYLWNGKTFSDISEMMIADAGAFDSETKLIFPSQKGGVSNQILESGETSTFDEKTDDYKLAERTEIVWNWNGKELKKVKEKTVKVK